MKRVVVLGDSGYYEPFGQFGPAEYDPSIILKSPNEVRFVLFTGGEDVTPKFYGHPTDRTVYSNARRDFIEQAIFRSAQVRNIPAIGICRGAQFLCVMAGGKLVQDTTGHNQYHSLMVRRNDGNVFVPSEQVSSTHHQMAYPWEMPVTDFILHAWSSEPLSRHYTYNGKRYERDDATDNMRLEPEVVTYPRIGALGFQFHPEYMSDESWCVKYTHYMTQQHLKEFER